MQGDFVEESKLSAPEYIENKYKEFIENTTPISTQLKTPNMAVEPGKDSQKLPTVEKESQGQGQPLMVPIDMYRQIITQVMAPIQQQMSQLIQMQSSIHLDVQDTKRSVQDNTKRIMDMNDNVTLLEARMKDRIELISETSANTESRVSLIENSLEGIKKCAEDAKFVASQAQAAATEVKSGFMGINVQVKKLTEKQLQEEVRSRRNNLRFLGIPEDIGKETPDISQIKLRKVLEKDFGLKNASEIKIIRAHRTGAKNPRFPRPIIAFFEKSDERMAVWRARFNIENNLLKCQEDFPTEILERRKILLPTFHAMRIFNITASDDDKFEVALVVDRLYVSNRLFNVHNIHHVPSPFKPEELAKREIDGTIFFFGGASPFSNHHKCRFNVQGNNYTSMEQFLFATKAQKANDRPSYDKIMASSNPVDIKHLGAEIVGISSLPQAVG